MTSKELEKTKLLLYEAKYDDAIKKLDEFQDDPLILEDDDRLYAELLRIMSHNGLTGKAEFRDLITMVDEFLKDQTLENYPKFAVDAIIEKIQAFYWLGKVESMLTEIEHAKNKLEMIDKLSNDFKQRKGMITFWNGYAHWLKNGPSGLKTIFEEAERLSDDIEFAEGIALSNLPLGVLEVIRGRPDIAMQKFEKSLKLFEDMHHEIGANWTKLHEGMVYRVKGDHNKAIKIHRKCLDKFEKYNHKLMESISLMEIGTDFKAKGDSEDGIEFIERALELTKQVGINYWVGEALDKLSEIYLHNGNLETALDYAKQNLEINKQIQNKPNTAWAHFQIGKIHNSLGNLHKAMVSNNLSKSLFEELNHDLGISKINSQIGTTQFLLGNLEDALTYAQKAMEIQEGHEMKFAMGGTAVIIAKIYYEMAEFDKAEEYLMQSIMIREDNKNLIESLSTSYYNMFKTQLIKRKYDEAKTYVSKLEKLEEQSDSPIIRQHYNLAHAQILKTSDKKTDRVEAIRTLRDLKDEGLSTYELKVDTECVLSNILIEDLSIKRNEPILAEVRTYIGNLEDLLEKEKSNLLYAETYSLEGALARVEKDHEKSKTYFDQAKSIAEDKKFDRIFKTYEIEPEPSVIDPEA